MKAGNDATLGGGSRAAAPAGGVSSRLPPLGRRGGGWVAIQGALLVAAIVAGSGRRGLAGLQRAPGSRPPASSSCWPASRC